MPPQMQLMVEKVEKLNEINSQPQHHQVINGHGPAPLMNGGKFVAHPAEYK